MASVKSDIVEYLKVVGYERLCLSCWLGELTDYLDEFLGLRLNRNYFKKILWSSKLELIATFS